MHDRILLVGQETAVDLSKSRPNCFMTQVHEPTELIRSAMLPTEYCADVADSHRMMTFEFEMTKHLGNIDYSLWDVRTCLGR